MKKRLLNCLLIVLAAVLTFAITGCSGEGEEKHEHTFASKWSSNETTHWHAATCEHKEFNKDKAAHSFPEMWTVKTAATEETAGEENRFCSICNYEATRAIPILPHTHKAGTKNEAVAATCTAKGSVEWFKCTKSSCEAKLDEDGNELDSVETVINPSNHSGTKTHFETTATTHTEIYDCCGAVKTEAADHSWNHQEYQYDSTSGKEIRNCTVCNYLDEKNHVHTIATMWSSDTINHWHTASCGIDSHKQDFAAHTEDDGTVTTQPTCTKKGVKTFKCKICDAFIRTEDVDFAAHTEDTGTVTTQPTCVTKGVKTYKCSICGNERQEDVPELYSSPVDADTGNAATSASTYVYFGVFPKTVLPETGADLEIVDEKVSVTMGGNVYYKGSKGNWYVKVTENCNSENEYTYTDGSTAKKISELNTRYFKVEPIKWKVIITDYNETKKALLLAEDALAGNVPYYLNEEDRIIGDNTVYPNNYKYSTVRAYLNGKFESDDVQDKTAYTDKGFLQTAFTKDAQTLIADTEVHNEAETTGYSVDTYATQYVCENTTDKIFLLSESEVINSEYGFSAGDIKGTESGRIRLPTDYVKANFAIYATGTWWWLRSPYQGGSDRAREVSGHGQAYAHASVIGVVQVIVPALTISLPNN